GPVEEVRAEIADTGRGRPAAPFVAGERALRCIYGGRVVAMHRAMDVREVSPCAAQSLLVAERFEERDRGLRELDYLIGAPFGIAEQPDVCELEPRPRFPRPVAGRSRGLDCVLEHALGARKRASGLKRRAEVAEELKSV